MKLDKAGRAKVIKLEKEINELELKA